MRCALCNVGTPVYDWGEKGVFCSKTCAIGNFMNDLPLEVLYKIALKVEPRDIESLRSTNVTLYNLFSDETFIRYYIEKVPRDWKHVLAHDLPESQLMKWVNALGSKVDKKYLLSAAQSGRVGLIRILLRLLPRDADVQLATKYAILNNRTGAVKLLLSDKRNQFTLNYVKYETSDEITDAILDAFPNELDLMLRYQFRQDNVHNAKRIAMRLDPEQLSYFLSLSAFERRIDMVRALASLPNADTSEALRTATRKGYQEIVEFLSK